MARKLALEILLKYQNEQSYINITLNHALINSELSRKDKDLVTQIVYGTVQNKLYLEYLLAPAIEGKKVHRDTKMILLMTLYQYYFLDKIPTYALCNEAVSLASRKERNQGRFVNAILHQIIDNPKRTLDGLDDDQRLSIETSHPLWMVKMFSKQYGQDITTKICQHNNATPNRIARVNTLKTKKESLLENPIYQTCALSTDAISYRSGNIASTPEYLEGLVTIQDESSQLVAPFLNPQKEERILDMCCAPGSKTTHLSALMENTGEIVACDLFEHKMELVQKNANRLGATNITFKVVDSTTLSTLYQEASFDRILLDAPCSGLGVLMRKPEIKYHDSSALDSIVLIQEKLLENAYVLLKNGGKMVYSTCTINKKENQKMIEQFIKKHPDMIVLEERQILPYEYNSDGFYMVKLKKE
ncbi:16S rRNA (cytosine(967)-C(5))-methyltransferase RsmB [Tannockella kyphosi]|uniref:16S rRNA (cytosine(967)-C(5))-methyltransferase RsmB n=1 Tax=Tannockella kyphosi TaxID=2899121 RepID=UPI002010FE55|nr:16S rRNA (cytosine(967)-C(5))-methyltransferase RsmB [Tannockella kyphosi]